MITAPLLFVFSLGYKIDWFGFVKVEDLRLLISIVSFIKSGCLLHKVVLRKRLSSYLFRWYVFVIFKDQRKFSGLCFFWIPKLAFSLVFAFLSMCVPWLIVSGHLAQHLLHGNQPRDRVWTSFSWWWIKRSAECLLYRWDYLPDSQHEILSFKLLLLFVQTNVLPGCSYLQGYWVGAVLSIIYLFLNFFCLSWKCLALNVCVCRVNWLKAANIGINWLPQEGCSKPCQPWHLNTARDGCSQLTWAACYSVSPPSQ